MVHDLSERVGHERPHSDGPSRTSCVSFLLGLASCLVPHTAYFRVGVLVMEDHDFHTLFRPMLSRKEARRQTEVYTWEMNQDFDLSTEILSSPLRETISWCDTQDIKASVEEATK